MPKQKLTEEQFHAAQERAIAEMPRGLSEEDFNQRMADAIAKEEQKVSGAPAPAGTYKKFGPMSQMIRDQYERGNNAQQFKNAFTEGAPTTFGMIGGLAGGPPGAAAGGAAGALYRDMKRAEAGSPDTPSALGAAGDVGLHAGIQGALSKGGDIAAQGLVRAGEWVGDQAVPLVRSALKPALQYLRHRAGIEGVTPSVVGNRIAKFLVDEGIRTPEAAHAIVESTGREADAAIKAAESNPNVSPVLNTSNRITQYLQDLLGKKGVSGIENTILPGQSRTAVQNFGKELVEDSPLSQYVPSTAKPSPVQVPAGGFQTQSLTKPSLTRPSLSGEPTRVPTETEILSAENPVSTRPRALRANVKPSEGMSMVREKSFYNPDSSGASLAAGKATERAVRDEIKQTVPDTIAPLTRQGRALDAERVLDRAAWRDANRDTLNMGGIIGLASKTPGLGLALQGLKEGQLGLGLAAPGIGRGISSMAPTVDLTPQLIRWAMLQQLQKQDKE